MYSFTIHQKPVNRPYTAEMTKNVDYYQDYDSSYNCNEPVSQSECSVLMFMRNGPLFIFVCMKIRAF